MANVLVPRAFFVKERQQAYSNWRIAFWRELFQNSWDAKASKVNIVLVSDPEDEDEDEGVTVSFSDNGPGMTRETLTDVYFQLGKSTKDSGDNIGGFGRARILTCFAMKRYQIFTNNNKVVGEGASYEIEDLDPPEPGCQLVIDVDGATRDDMYKSLTTYLRECDCPSEVFINGVQWSDDCAKGEWIRNLEYQGRLFATVYYNKDYQYGSNKTVIRVNGVSMFTRYNSVPGKITIELNSDISREVLTSNRDGLHNHYNDVLRQFEDELSSETQTALRPKLVTDFRVFEGKGFLRSVSPKVQQYQSLRPIRDQPEPPPSTLVELSHKLREHVKGATQATPMRQVVDSPSGGGKMIVSRPREYSVAEFIPTVPILIETENETLVRLAEKFDPRNWRFEIIGGMVKWIGGCENHVKQYFMWKIACEHAVRALLKTGYYDDLSWAAGFYFGPDQAKCKTMEGGYGLLINPATDDGKLRFSIREKMHLKIMMAKAKHEVAHIHEFRHDETYAWMLTEIDGNYDEWRCLADMMSAK